MRADRGWSFWVDEACFLAAAEAEEDAWQASSSATTTVNPSVTQPASATWASSSQPVHQASSSSAADSTSNAAAGQAAGPVCMSSAPSKAVSWAVPAERALVQPQPVGQAGIAPGKEWSSVDTSSNSTTKTTTNEPDENQEGHVLSSHSLHHEFPRPGIRCPTCPPIRPTCPAIRPIHPPVSTSSTQETIAMIADQCSDLHYVETDVGNIQQWTANLLPEKDRVRHEDWRKPWIPERSREVDSVNWV